MPPDTPNSETLDAVSLLPQHPVPAIWIGALCLWISLSLIARMWVVHRKTPFLTKLLWSFVLLVPVLGWLFYGGLFRVPGSNDTECPTEHSRDAPYTGDHF
ncbi:MAG TPA: hypothetical protein VIT91_15810 [Chthoniobacterales bacterium]